MRGSSRRVPRTAVHRAAVSPSCRPSSSPYCPKPCRTAAPTMRNRKSGKPDDLIHWAGGEEWATRAPSRQNGTVAARPYEGTRGSVISPSSEHFRVIGRTTHLRTAGSCTRPAGSDLVCTPYWKRRRAISRQKSGSDSFPRNRSSPGFVRGSVRRNLSRAPKESSAACRQPGRQYIADFRRRGDVARSRQGGKWPRERHRCCPGRPRGGRLGTTEPRSHAAVRPSLRAAATSTARRAWWRAAWSCTSPGAPVSDTCEVP